MPTHALTEFQLRKILQNFVDEHGIAGAAARLHVTTTLLGEVIRHGRPLGDKIPAALGYEKRFLYVKNTT
jgi:hypothetical protein